MLNTIARYVFAEGNRVTSCRVVTLEPHPHGENKAKVRTNEDPARVFWIEKWRLAKEPRDAKRIWRIAQQEAAAEEALLKSASIGEGPTRLEQRTRAEQ